MDEQTDIACCRLEPENEFDTSLRKTSFSTPLHSDNERESKKTANPAANRLTENEVFLEHGAIDTDKIKEHFNVEGRLDLICTRLIIEKATEILRQEETLVTVEGNPSV